MSDRSGYNCKEYVMGKLYAKPISEWTFQADDKLGLKEFADRFLSYLAVDHHFVPNSLVVSLDGPYGSGKTTFLSMWNNYLIEQRKNGSGKTLPVLINAWKDDFCGDPLLSLVLSLIEAVKSDGPKASSKTVEKLNNAVLKVAWVALGLGNGVVKKFAGVDCIAAEKLAEEKTAEEVPDVLKLFKYRRAAIATLKDCLTETFSGDEVQAIVIIDELDRCRPDYAVAFLETIKHIFDVPGVIFVLAIDREQLAGSARVLFGPDLNASEYLRKFISRSFELPKPSDSGVSHFVKSQVLRFMELPDVRHTSFDSSYLDKRASELCKDFQLTLRQIEEVFRIMGHAFSTTKAKETVKPSWSQGILLLCALKVKDDVTYRHIGRQNFSTKELLVFLLQFMSDADVCHWGTLYHTGRHRDDSPYEPFDHVWSSLGKQRAPSFTGASLLEQHFEANWGDIGSDRIQQIYEWIETAVTA